MTIDELIAAVDERARCQTELDAARKALDRVKVKPGYYQGSDGRLLKVDKHEYLGSDKYTFTVLRVNDRLEKDHD